MQERGRGKRGRTGRGEGGVNLVENGVALTAHLNFDCSALRSAFIKIIKTREGGREKKEV